MFYYGIELTSIYQVATLTVLLYGTSNVVRVAKLDT